MTLAVPEWWTMDTQQCAPWALRPSWLLKCVRGLPTMGRLQTFGPWESAFTCSSMVRHALTCGLWHASPCSSHLEDANSDFGLDAANRHPYYLHLLAEFQSNGTFPCCFDVFSHFSSCSQCASQPVSETCYGLCVFRYGALQASQHHGAVQCHSHSAHLLPKQACCVSTAEGPHLTDAVQRPSQESNSAASHDPPMDNARQQPPVALQTGRRDTNASHTDAFN